MGLQRVEHDLAPKQQYIMYVCIYYQGTERVNRSWVVYLTSVSAVTSHHRLSGLKCHKLGLL